MDSNTLNTGQFIGLLVVLVVIAGCHQQPGKELPKKLQLLQHWQLQRGNTLLKASQETITNESLVNSVSSNPDINPQLTTAGKSTVNAATLFANAHAPGALAVGVTEGNFNLKGGTTAIYLGHTDPGNHVTNRGFCSWNHAENLTVAEADNRCLAALQRQAQATEQKLLALGIDPKKHLEALVNGTDLWNQSDTAGPHFAANYKKALDEELSVQDALVGARVEAFRNAHLQLNASGLFGICATQPYYQSRLNIYLPNSESWRWECIALDQKRRVGEVHKALQQRLGSGGVGDQGSDDRDPGSDGALNFDVQVSTAEGNTSPVAASPSLSHSATPLNFNPNENFSSSPAIPAKIPMPQVVPATLTRWALHWQQPPKIGDTIAGYVVTSGFGMRIHPITGLAHFHGGVDLATPMNTNLYGIGAPGTTTTLKCWFDSNGGGLVATMTSPTFPTWRFDALHLNMCKAPANGPKVQLPAGSLIGSTGTTGYSTGPHLHFQVRDLNTRQRISPPDGLIFWVLTGNQPSTAIAAKP